MLIHVLQCTLKCHISLVLLYYEHIEVVNASWLVTLQICYVHCCFKVQHNLEQALLCCASFELCMPLKALHTTPYQVNCNGMVEPLYGVLKSILKKKSSVHTRKWECYIPATLFAYKEMSNDLKLSPYEWLYERTVRPLEYIAWALKVKVKRIYQCVTNLRTRLEETAKWAATTADISSWNYEQFYAWKLNTGDLDIGDEVLVCLPSNHTKLKMQWTISRENKLFCKNMLRRYHQCESLTSKEKVIQVCIVEESNTENQSMYCKSTQPYEWV